MTYQPPQPAYGHPARPPKRTNRTLLIVIGAVVGVFLLLCVCGFVVALATGDDPEALPAAPSAAVPTTEPATAPTRPPTLEPPPADEGLRAAAPTSAAPELVAMPKVVGENAAVANDQLRKLGFTNLQFGSQDENDTLVIMLANWTVTKQSTKAGKKIPTDTLIVITCTKQ